MNPNSKVPENTEVTLFLKARRSLKTNHFPLKRLFDKIENTNYSLTFDIFGAKVSRFFTPQSISKVSQEIDYCAIQLQILKSHFL